MIGKDNTIMRIPAKEECFRLIEEMEMMEHIVAHSEQVCRVALFLTDNLNKDRVRLNRSLIRASALLHDITKTRSFKTGEKHAETGDEFLCDLNYPEVGSIVGQHVRVNSTNYGFPNEAEIVNYADKRVLHDRVVPLYDRMKYILDTYGKGGETRHRIRWLWKETLEMEERIFKYLPFSPDDIIGIP